MTHVGQDKLLLDDVRRMAVRLVATTSSAELRVPQGLVHVVPANIALLRTARKTLDIMAAVLHHHLRG